MASPRTLLLFDPEAQPSSWNERMAPGEYAVHYSQFDGGQPVCTILASLPEAEAYAREQVALKPTLRCRIYDHNGFIGAPVEETKGLKYVGDSDFSPRFRHWAGSLLFFGGILLTLIDWRSRKDGRRDSRLPVDGQSWKNAIALGALLNTRGLVELIVLNIAYNAHIFSPTLFTMLVVMALVTTMMTTPILDILKISNTATKEPRIDPSF